MQQPPTTLVRLPEVIRRVALSRSSIYLLMAKGRFPMPIKIGARARGWVERDVEAWLQAKIESSHEHLSYPRPRA